MSTRKAKLIDPELGAKGKRFHVYVNNKVDSELIDFINKQSDVSGTIMLGLLELYNKFGNVDLSDYLPRNFKVNSSLPQATTLNNGVAKQQDTLPPTQQIEPERTGPPFLTSAITHEVKDDEVNEITLDNTGGSDISISQSNKPLMIDVEIEDDVTSHNTDKEILEEDSDLDLEVDSEVEDQNHFTEEDDDEQKSDDDSKGTGFGNIPYGGGLFG